MYHTIGTIAARCGELTQAVARLADADARDCAASLEASGLTWEAAIEADDEDALSRLNEAHDAAAGLVRARESVKRAVDAVRMAADAALSASRR